MNREWTRAHGLASAHTRGAIMLNYRYLAEEALRFGRGQLSVVAVRLPSRPQAPGELSRSDPMARLASPADVDDGLDTLIECYRLRLLHRRLRRGRKRLLREQRESAPTEAREPGLMAEESALLGSRRAPDGRPLAGEPPAPERVADRIEPDEVRYDGDVTPRVSALQAAVEAPREEATAPPRWWAEAAMRS